MILYMNTIFDWLEKPILFFDKISDYFVENFLIKIVVYETKFYACECGKFFEISNMANKHSFVCNKEITCITNTKKRKYIPGNISSETEIIKSIYLDRISSLNISKILNININKVNKLLNHD